MGPRWLRPRSEHVPVTDDALIHIEALLTECEWALDLINSYRFDSGCLDMAEDPVVTNARAFLAEQRRINHG